MSPDATIVRPYDPKTADLLSFNRAIPAFRDGSDTPRAFLERCLERIDAEEAAVKAFVTLNVEAARAAADAAGERYRDGRPLSCVDGMPVAIKDVFYTEDMPTQMGSPIFEGWQSGWDGPAVFWLRKGGAAILGKTVTTEFAFGAPGPTRNPWDTERTPGGSSSGTAAAVAARMVPVGTGSQVRGSVLRPAAFCGAYALKPSYGTLNTLGGFPSAPSLCHLGILGGSLSDTWMTAHYISHAAGGDPGHASLGGKPDLPGERRPWRLIRLDTAGWDETPRETREVFEALLESLEAQDVSIIGRRDDPEIEALEQELAQQTPYLMDILTWEGRYPLALYAERHPELLGQAVAARVEASRKMTPADYGRAQSWCRALRGRYDSLRGKADGFITLNATGAAPEGMAVGNPIYGDVSSVLGTPAFNLPLMAIDGMPLGLQLMGFYRTDFELAAVAHWLVHVTIGRVAERGRGGQDGG